MKDIQLLFNTARTSLEELDFLSKGLVGGKVRAEEVTFTIEPRNEKKYASFAQHLLKGNYENIELTESKREAYEKCKIIRIAPKNGKPSEKKEKVIIALIDLIKAISQYKFKY